MCETAARGGNQTSLARVGALLSRRMLQLGRPVKPALPCNCCGAVTALAVIQEVSFVTHLVFQEADPLREWGGLHLGVNQEVDTVCYLLFPHFSRFKMLQWVVGSDVGSSWEN